MPRDLSDPDAEAASCNGAARHRTAARHERSVAVSTIGRSLAASFPACETKGIGGVVLSRRGRSATRSAFGGLAEGGVRRLAAAPQAANGSRR